MIFHYFIVVNLEDDDENAKKHSKSFTTTIFTPKALGKQKCP